MAEHNWKFNIGKTIPVFEIKFTYLVDKQQTQVELFDADGKEIRSFLMPLAPIEKSYLGVKLKNANS